MTMTHEEMARLMDERLRIILPEVIPNTLVWEQLRELTAEMLPRLIDRKPGLLYSRMFKPFGWGITISIWDKRKR